MKRLLLILIAGLTLINSLAYFSGCRGVVVGSGDLETRTFNNTGFTKVQAQNGFDVRIIQASSFNIEVTTDDNIWEYLNVKKSGDTLVINFEWNRSYISVTKQAVIYMPNFEGIELSGGSEATVSGFSSGNPFEGKLSGGSELSGAIEAGNVELYLSGGSKVTLAGAGNTFTIDSSGGSKANLADFSVGNSQISISGGGSADVTMNGVLDAHLSGGSRIYYTGQVEMGSLDLSGGSSIHKR